MQGFWVCENCGDENGYPEDTVCGTCGEKRTPAAEQKAIDAIKKEEERLERERKEEERKRREEERALREAERKRQEEIKAAKRAEMERKRLAALQASRLKAEAREKKIADVSRGSSKFLTAVIRIAAVVLLVFSVVIFIRNNDDVKFKDSWNTIAENVQTEYYAHTVSKGNSSSVNYGNVTAYNGEASADGGERASRVAKKIGDQFSYVFREAASNVENEFTYLKDRFDPVGGFNRMIDTVVQFVSGGNEK